MNIHDLDTPAVLIDIDRVERNLARLADYVRDHGLVLRPHTKTHKLPEMALLQLKHGAGGVTPGVTVAKVGEAEVMAAAGVGDILIAYPVVGAEKAARVAKLARERTLDEHSGDRRAQQLLAYLDEAKNFQHHAKAVA